MIAGAFVVKFGSVLLLSFEPSPGLCMGISLVTYLVLFYGLYPNLRLPGFVPMALGMFLNFMAIMANGSAC